MGDLITIDNIVERCDLFTDIMSQITATWNKGIFRVEFLNRSEYMSRIPRHVSSRVYVSHSETCKQPSVDLVHISECEIHGGP